MIAPPEIQPDTFQLKEVAVITSYSIHYTKLYDSLVIFDLDGTLIDTLPGTFRAVREAVGPALGREPTEDEIRARFGPGFDPDQVERSVIGSADFTWSSCDSGRMQWRIDGDGGPLRQGRIV